MKAEQHGKQGRDNGSSPAMALSDLDKAAQEEHDIDQIRDRLGGLVTELDRRRRRMAPSALVRAHPALTVLLGASLLGAAVVGLVWQLRRTLGQGSADGPGARRRRSATLRPRSG